MLSARASSSWTAPQWGQTTKDAAIHERQAWHRIRFMHAPPTASKRVHLSQPARGPDAALRAGHTFGGGLDRAVTYSTAAIVTSAPAVAAMMSSATPQVRAHESGYR
jgi:hypothetical protein